MSKNNQLEKIIPTIGTSFFKSEKIIFTKASNISVVLSTLKYHINSQYRTLSCLSGVDFLYSKHRFSVVYELLGFTFSSRIRVKIFVNEISAVDSSVGIFINAEWLEREVWDLYGIYFAGHKDLRRILTDYGFEGFPMRKDYPLSGFIELRYDQNKKRIVVENIELAQDFRFFSFESTW